MELRPTQYGIETAHKVTHYLYETLLLGLKITNMKLVRILLSFLTDLTDSDLYFGMYIRFLVMCRPDVYLCGYLMLLEKCCPDWYL